MLAIDKSLNANLEQVICDIFKGDTENKIFSRLVIESSRTIVESAGKQLEVHDDTGVQYISKNQISYN